jgi:hypothetical protein
MRFSWELVEVWSRIGARASDPGCPLPREVLILPVYADLPVVERAKRDETRVLAVLSCVSREAC